MLDYSGPVMLVLILGINIFTFFYLRHKIMNVERAQKRLTGLLVVKGWIKSPGDINGAEEA